MDPLLLDINDSTESLCSKETRGFSIPIKFEVDVICFRLVPFDCESFVFVALESLLDEVASLPELTLLLELSDLELFYCFCFMLFKLGF
jgi:hypothetical protein